MSRADSGYEDGQEADTETSGDPWHRILEYGHVSNRPCVYVNFADGSSMYYGWRDNSRQVAFQPGTLAEEAMKQLTEQEHSYVALEPLGEMRMHDELYDTASVDIDQEVYDQARNAVGKMDFDKDHPTGVLTEPSPSASMGLPHNRGSNSAPQDAFMHLFEQFLNPKKGRW